MPEPSNKALYERVKKKIYAKIPKHSAYRSGLLVKEYKKQGGTYKGSKPTAKEGGNLKSWFSEKWKTQTGSTTYKKKGDIFRPTVRVSKKTPSTMSELSAKEKKDAIKEKKATGRVKKYKKS